VVCHQCRSIKKETNVTDLNGQIAWVTGAGTGIGEAGALALARAGMTLVLTGRRREPLDAVAKRIAADGGTATVETADVANAAAVRTVADAIGQKFGRLDVLVNNAGLNIPERGWGKLKPDGIAAVINANLAGAFYVAQAALPLMRGRGGVMIHTASWAGRFIGPVSGPAYMAAKHGVVAMSHSLNLEEGRNGIRSSVLCPGEVATPILQNRSPPETPEAMARMLQSDDMGSLIAYIARQPAHVCINEVVISPTHNRGYARMMEGR
jgi:NAD(P)-dependent dehydrogenase (short-subunit alcohol dehydrogenase family)